MARISEDVVNVVGDSLEACLYSRYLASMPEIKQVNHYTTGEYGGFYFDEKKDDSYVALFLTSTQLDRVKEFMPTLREIPLCENYLKAPVKKIRFSNPYDEYIPYPINKTSFEVEMDYEDNILRKYTYEEFLKEYKDCKNITKLMKSVFSESIYMNLIKKIGCNQWGLNQSQMEVGRLYNILNLGQIGSDVEFKYFYPNGGVSLLCKNLLNNQKISIKHGSRKDIKKATKSQLDKVTYYFEYIDYYMDFMFGPLEYVKAETEIHNKSISEYKYFRVYTPFDKNHYAYFGVEAYTYRTRNVPTKITTHNFSRSLIVPSQSNYRKIYDYRKVSAVSRNFKIMV